MTENARSLFVMAGHSRRKDGVASARLCPSRPSTSSFLTGCLLDGGRHGAGAAAPPRRSAINCCAVSTATDNRYGKPHLVRFDGGGAPSETLQNTRVPPPMRLNEGPLARPARVAGG